MHDEGPSLETLDLTTSTFHISVGVVMLGKGAAD